MAVDFPKNFLTPIFDFLNSMFVGFFSNSDAFWLGTFPYIAIFIAFFGIFHRFRSHEFSYSSQSSQFLNRGYALPQALNFFHYGLLVVLLVHFLLIVFAILIPGVLKDFYANQTFIVEVFETLLWAFTIGIIFGLVFFLVRRLFDTRARQVTTKLDWIILLIIFLEVNLGFLVATVKFPGSSWYSTSIVPWFVSIVQLSPEYTEVATLAPLVKVHIITGFLIFALLPYTRLVHLMSFPYGYLWRRYQVAVWYSKKTNPYDRR